jgi:hypothetical protein
VLAFKVLLHSFELSQTICGPGVSGRFVSGTTVAVTFAEDSVWPVLLNTAFALIRFVLDAEEHWSFSRVGTHCLENFFGLVRRESLGDDRSVAASRVIAKTSLASSVIHDLNLSITDQGRDNVDGTAIGGCDARFAEVAAERLSRSLIHVSSLEFYPAAGTDVLSVNELRCVLLEWSGEDHHADDPVYQANFLGKSFSAGIAARLIQSSS